MEKCYCDITDSNVNKVVYAYLKRNIINVNQTGITVIKVPNIKYDTSNYEFYISEIFKQSSIESNSPTAYTIINERLILLYGWWDVSRCHNKYYDFYSSVVSESLLNDTLKTGDNGEMNLRMFDPEILEVTIKNKSIVSENELSKQPVLN